MNYYKIYRKVRREEFVFFPHYFEDVLIPITTKNFKHETHQNKKKSNIGVL